MFQGKTRTVFYDFTAKLCHTAVGQHYFQSTDIISGDTVFYGAHSSCIGADISADGRCLLARVRRVKQAFLLHQLLKIFQHYTGFHRCRKSILINLQHPIHAGQIQNDPSVRRYRRTYKIGPCSSRCNRNLMIICVFHNIADLSYRLRKYQRFCPALEPSQSVR